MPLEHSQARAGEPAALIGGSPASPPPAAGGPLTPEAAQSEFWAQLIEQATNDDTDAQAVLEQAMAYCAGGYWHEGINEIVAAKFLGVEHRSMQKWRQTGGGPKYSAYSSRCLRYRRIDLKHWQDARIRSSTSDPGHEANIS